MDGIVGIDEDGSPRIGKEHLVEMRLNDFPRNVPYIRFNTPIFHPNINSNGDVCMGWFGLPYSLTDVCIHIAKMIDYQIYNVSAPPYPSDSRAAEWAKMHTSLFPLTNWVARDLRKSAKIRLSKNRKLRIKRAEQKTINITLLTLTTGESHSVDVPANMAVRELKSSLIREIGLPSKFENGWPVEYQLVNRTKGISLMDELTLAENGVAEGDTLVFHVHTVAG
jgi:hypothetical protein